MPEEKTPINLRDCYTLYLMAFGDPERAERSVRPWHVMYPGGVPQDPDADETRERVLAALGQMSSMVLPPAVKLETVEAPQHFAVAIKLAKEPHGDDDLPLSFNAFVAQFRAVLPRS